MQNHIDAYLSVVAFIAIFNIGIGFFLGYRAAYGHGLRLADRREAIVRAKILVESRTRQATAATPPATASSITTDDISSNEPRTEMDVPAVATEWQNRGQQLTNVKDKIACAFSTADKQLLKDASRQLRMLADSWMLFLENDPTVPNGKPSETEFLLAQLETTMSNLGSLDWDDPFESLQMRLEREVAILEKS